MPKSPGLSRLLQLFLLLFLLLTLFSPFSYQKTNTWCSIHSWGKKCFSQFVGSQQGQSQQRNLPDLRHFVAVLHNTFPLFSIVYSQICMVWYRKNYQLMYPFAALKNKKLPLYVTWILVCTLLRWFIIQHLDFFYYIIELCVSEMPGE